jgi:hypothetical protein
MRWLAKKHGRKSRMPLRRRRNEPEKIQLCLRRSGISGQAKKEQKNQEVHAAPSHEIRKAKGLAWVQGVRCFPRDPLAYSSALRAPNGLLYLRVGGRGQCLRCRKSSKPEKCLKIAQTPTRQVQAVLANLPADQNLCSKR